MRLRAETLALVLLCAMGAALSADDPSADKDAARKHVRELNARVVELYKQGHYSDAKSQAEQAVSIAESSLGVDDLDTARSLNIMAATLQAMGDLEAAKPAYERAWAIREKVLGPEHPETASSLNNLALLLHAQGDFQGARTLFERALAIYEKPDRPDLANTASCLGNLARVHQAQGDLDGARPLYERALAIRQKVLAPDHPDVAKALANLAQLLHAEGDLNGARPLYERALAIREKALGPDHPDTAKSLNDVGRLLQAQGDLRRARPLYERALAIREKALGPDHPDTAQSLNNLGLLLEDLGDYEGARHLLDQALAIREKKLGPGHPDTAQSLNNLAALLQTQGNPEGARPLFQRVLAIREKSLPPDHPDTATSLNNLAAVLRTLGDPKGARPLLERALAISEKVLGPEHPVTATAVSNLAAVLRDLEDRQGAIALEERALAIREKALGLDHPETAESLNILAELRRDMGDVQGAAPLCESAWDANRVALHVLLPALSGEQRRSLLRSRAGQFAHYVSGLADDPGRTYAAALAWKGSALRTSLAAERLPDDAPNELRDAARRLADARRTLAGLFLGHRTPQPGDPTIRDQAEAVEKEIGSLEALLAEKAPDFAARAFLDTSVEDVRQALPEGAALLDLLENSATLHAWVLPKKGSVRYFNLGKAVDIEPLASRFREALEKDDAKGWEEAGAALLQQLGPSLAAALEGTTSLYLSPDGALATIPWGLLPDGSAKDHRFLIERLPIVQVHGGAGIAMAARTASEKRGEGLVAYGDVDYTGVQPPPPPLPATKKEVEGIAALYKGNACRVRTGKEASKAAFLREAGSSRYVHVATHGFFDLENLRVAAGTRGFAGPIQSASLAEAPGERSAGSGWNPLLLSGILLAAGEGQDGVLTAEELQSQDLRRVELVVLSACETGRGELAAGEGVLGLSRALVVAGARGFMLSLWQVPDDKTRELMGGFYAGLWGDKPLPAEDALRATQLRMLARDREKNAFHPRDWGAWVLSR